MVLIQYARIHPETTTHGVRESSPVFRDLRVLNLEAAPEFGHTLDRDVSDAVFPTNVIKEGKSVSMGTFDIMGRPDDIGELTEMAFGQVTNALVGTSARTLTYDPLEDPTTRILSYGLDFGLEKSKEYQILGLMCTAMRWSKADAGPLQCAYTLAGSDMKDASFSVFTPSLSSLDPLAFVTSAADAQIGSTNIKPTALTFDFSNGYTFHTPHTSRTPTAINLGNYEVSVTLTLRQKDVTALINDGLDEDTNPTFNYKLSGTADQIESGHTYEISIQMAKTDIVASSLTLRGQEQPKTVDITLNALKPSTGNFCRVVIKSEETTPS